MIRVFEVEHRGRLLSAFAFYLDRVGPWSACLGFFGTRQFIADLSSFEALGSQLCVFFRKLETKEAASEFLGDIGSISPERHRRLLRRLARYPEESASEPNVA